MLALPKIRNEVILKDAKKRILNPAADTIHFLPGILVLYKNFHKVDKLDSNWVDKIYTVVSAFKNNTYLIADVKTGRVLKRRANGTHHLRKYFNRDSIERCRS